MKLPRRRQFLHLAAGAAALSLVPRLARAQAYPSRPVRIIVSIIASVDEMLVQFVSQWLSERLGQPFTIDNQPSAGARIGAEAILNASPDGHTLALVIAANLIQAIHYDKLSFIRDLAPVAGISRNPFVMVVNPSVPAKTVSEFIANANANPGKLSMASSGNGSILHLAGELFTSITKVGVVHAPYRGMAPAIADLLTGQVHAMFLPVPNSLQHIKDGKLRALAVTSPMRSSLLPDVPTVGEAVRGYEASGLQGLCAPKNTPTEIIDKLNKEINLMVADSNFKRRLAEFGNTVLSGWPADFGKLMMDDTEKWASIIRAANIKPG
jgi:tripartite-type tricarboxylate transporter receptor subunit TctC